ncbi:MAG: hypothetical protein RL346_1824 [Verrucomicrobiota bacterium]|jgi:hypothetical protein
MKVMIPGISAPEKRRILDFRSFGMREVDGFLRGWTLSPAGREDLADRFHKCTDAGAQSRFAKAFHSEEIGA